jgi:Protein of unknown function (DUF2652)
MKNILKNNKLEIYNALFVVPDICGFTNFITKAKIHHSREKISVLMESFLDSNILDLSVAEIEGDAIIFYGLNKNFTLQEIIEECKYMFKTFNQRLVLISNKNKCKCGACAILKNLKLKIILHYGEVCKYMIKDYCKLFGQDLVLIHRLLKNEIPLREYLLFTDGFCENYGPNIEEHIDWAKKKQGSTQYKVIGKVNYTYVNLKPLRKSPTTMDNINE